MVKEVRKPMAIPINKVYRDILEEKLKDRKIYLPKLMDAMATRILALGWNSKYALDNFSKYEDYKNPAMIYGTDSKIYDGLQELGEPYEVTRAALIKRELYGLALATNEKLINDNLKDLRKYAGSYDRNYPNYIGVPFEMMNELRKADLNGLMEFVIKRHIEGLIDLKKYLYNDEITRERIKTSTAINKDVQRVKIARANRMIDNVANKEFMVTKDLMFAVLEYIRVNPIVIGEYHTYMHKLKKPLSISLGKDVVTLLGRMMSKGKIKDYGEYITEAMNSVTIDELEDELVDKVKNNDAKKDIAMKYELNHCGKTDLKKIEDICYLKTVKYFNWSSMIDSIVKLKYIKDKKKER